MSAFKCSRLIPDSLLMIRMKPVYHHHCHHHYHHHHQYVNRLVQMTVFEYWEQRNTHIVDSSLMKSVVDTTRVRRTSIWWCWKSIALNVHCASIASWSWFAATLSQVSIIEQYHRYAINVISTVSMNRVTCTRSVTIIILNDHDHS